MKEEIEKCIKELYYIKWELEILRYFTDEQK